MTRVHYETCDMGLDCSCPQPRYAIAGDREATWALRRLARAEDEARRVDALADDERERITAWQAQARRQADRDAAFFRGLLAEYHCAELGEVDPEDEDRWKRRGDKTRSLPSGTVAAKRIPARVHVEDSSAFVAWAIPAGRLELVRTTAAVTEIAKVVTRAGDAAVDTATGELIPGLTFAPPRISVTVTATKDEQPAWLPAPDGVDLPEHAPEPEADPGDVTA